VLENAMIDGNHWRTGDLASRTSKNGAAREIDMKLRWIVIALAGFGVMAAAPGAAQARHRHQRHCLDRNQEFSWLGIFTNPRPQPNGCAPAVFYGGEYIGQDPDPNIRSQLKRQPSTGYALDLVR
jgi:hypothetical protein